MCSKSLCGVLILGAGLLALAPVDGADVVWDFEDGNTHDFVLRCVNPAARAADDPETAGDEAITGVGGSNGLPNAGIAWTVCDLYAYVGMKPAVTEGQNIVNGKLVAQSALPKAAGPSALGQSGYLNTYALNLWGDVLHKAANDQIATSPRVRLAANSMLTAYVIGGMSPYHAPEQEADPALGYTDGSCGIAILGTDGKLLMSLGTPSQNGKEWTMDLSSLAGTEVYVELVDAFEGGWGWIAFDQVKITDAVVTGISGKVFASTPDPVNGGADVPRDSVVLAWGPGKLAKTHDVYFGTRFDDVNTASRASPRGVLVSQGQDATTYDPAGLLAFGQTYYWRIDEVNAAPDSTLYTGKIWSFTTETYGYPVKPIKATASSVMTSAMGPEKTIDGSGLDAATDEHSVSASQGWLSKKGLSPVWIQYEFDAVYSLHEMWVWNSNQAVEPVVGFGAKDVTIETSVDGTTWTALAGVPEFAQATGEPNYVYNTTVSFGGVQAKFVKLTVNANWADGTKQAGLAEVRFFYVPVKAFGPTPPQGATGVALDATLNWRPGREAVAHEVILGSDATAVANGTAPLKKVSEHHLDLAPLGLEYARTYYWKVNEVNDAAATKSWEGNVWSFTAIGYGVLDDFDAYDDQCKRVFFSWVDGFGHSGSADCGVAPSAGNGTGSTVGNINPPFAERAIVHSGRQSMPMGYDNTKSPFYSETQRDWTAAQSWTGGGANTLTVWLRGDAAAFLETSPGTLIMNGTGTDIWANGDQFRFACKSLKGNGSITARVDSVAQTDGWAKAGVMIRESVDPASAHAMVVVTPANSVSFQRRVNTGDVSGNTDVTGGLKAPYWVKVTRNGNTFTGQCSPDGVAWTDITATPAVTVTMANDVLIGLAATSHLAGAVCGAKFSSVSTTGSVSGGWQTADIGVPQVNGNTPEDFYVAVQDSAGKLKVLTNPDKSVIATGVWQQWDIPLSQFTSTGVSLGSIKKMIVGVGDRSAPKAGSAGKLYIDDIRLTRVGP